MILLVIVIRDNRMNLLVLGASGMLGNAIFRVLSEKDGWEVYGTIRSAETKKFFDPILQEKLILVEDVQQQDSLVNLFTRVRPDVVINCVGIVKQLAEASEPLVTLPLNSVFPHRLNQLCELLGARLIHLSTDCVFSGRKGGYVETDIPDAEDLYGRSKVLGEVFYPNSVTLRTSTIGYELGRSKGLLEWFLRQGGQCKGFKKAIFSGLPAVVLAEVIKTIVIPNVSLSGLYHVASDPISKYDLLNIIASAFDKKINIIPDEELNIDRSLVADSFKEATGYVSPSWSDLIETMKSYEIKMEDNVYR